MIFNTIDSYSLFERVAFFANHSASDKVALVDWNVSYTYKQCLQEVNRLSFELKDFCLDSRIFIGLCMERCVDFAVAMIAASKLNACIYAFDPKAPLSDFESELHLLSPDILISDQKGLETLNCLNLEKSDVKSFHDKFIIKLNLSNNHFKHLLPQEVVYINSTSGTTSHKKYGLVTVQNLSVNTQAVLQHYEMNESCCYACLFPSHMHPHELVYRPLFIGGTAVLLPEGKPRETCILLNQRAVTHIMGTPNQYFSLLSFCKQRFPNLIMLECAGGRLSVALEKKIAEKMLSPVRSYGSTEATGVFLSTYGTDDSCDNALGRVLPFYNVETTEEQELIVFGDGVLSLLYEQDFGFVQIHLKYNTGDVVYRKKDFYYFRFRKKHILKVCGEYVFPDVIENILLLHPTIQEAVVVSAKDDIRGEVPVAIVVPKTPLFSEAEIISFCSQHLKSYEVPKDIIAIKQFPINEKGKVDFKVLEQLAQMKKGQTQ